MEEIFWFHTSFHESYTPIILFRVISVASMYVQNYIMISYNVVFVNVSNFQNRNRVRLSYTYYN